ncbi:MAG: fumarate hydratase [Candidatus Omnitrophica bacterium]|nr:fumarate hydratase [Candidatus Omnitrophota bacterium]
MRIIDSRKIKEAVSDLAIKANINLRPDVLDALKKRFKSERKKEARCALGYIIDNARIAKKEHLAICQDTGLPVVFIDLGDQVHVRGNLNNAVQAGISDGYRKARLRQSVILDPLRQSIKTDFVPALVNVRILKGKRMGLAVLPKGFGCENKAACFMFNPTTDIENIIDWIIDVTKRAGPDACPPYVLGVGIGGTADEAARLAKHALLRPINKKNQDKFLSRLEKKLLDKINRSGIGAFGLGGNTTALGVNIETAPTHIAGLPVAVNVSCHALRSARKIL